MNTHIAEKSVVERDIEVNMEIGF